MVGEGWGDQIVLWKDNYGSTLQVDSGEGGACLDTKGRMASLEAVPMV